jgi:hypothetical protein
MSVDPVDGVRYNSDPNDFLARGRVGRVDRFAVIRKRRER